MISLAALGFFVVAHLPRIHFGSVQGNDKRVQLLGRGIRTNEALRFGWPASGFVIRFRGQGVRLVLRDTTRPDETRDNDELQFRLDDQRDWSGWNLLQGENSEIVTGPETDKMKSAVERMLDKQEHVLVVRKATEAEVGTVDLLSVIPLHGVDILDAHAAKRRSIEIVGDSISAGFGNEGDGPDCPFSPDTEDATLTYGAHAAEILGYDFSIVAESGKGIVHNDDARDSLTLPMMYERATPDQPDLWRFPSPAPDVVVVNLGTNDVRIALPDHDGFVSGYAHLLDTIHAHSPAARVIVILSPMVVDSPDLPARTALRTWLNEISKSASARFGIDVPLVEFWAIPSEGFGCQYHPNERAHQRFGRQLAEAIEKLAVPPSKQTP